MKRYLLLKNDIHFNLIFSDIIFNRLIIPKTLYKTIQLKNNIIQVINHKSNINGYQYAKF